MNSHVRFANASPMRLARFAGCMYLLQMATGVFAQLYARGSLLVRGDAEQTVLNIMQSEALFRLSIITDMVCYTAVLLASWALYVLLRPIDRNLALLALALRLMELAIHYSATVNSLAALRLIAVAQRFPDEAATFNQLATAAVSVQGAAVNLGFILLGLGSSIFAFLLYKSGYLPRMIGAWGIGASLLLALFAAGIVIAPSLASLQYIPMLPMGLFEVSLGVWLLTKGVQASDESGVRPPLSTPA
ncbi:MAG: DUF4386 domain-containing protein [Pseudomarimonas sp.]